MIYSFCFMFDLMNAGDKTTELLEKINALNKSIDQCMQEIGVLKAEVEALKKSKTVAGSPVQKTSSITVENFVGLKLIHFVGIIVLITGLSIGVKYAIDSNLISPLMRIVLAYIAGAALFLLSLKLKEKYSLFSAILFSGAVASAYFTTYAAFTYYGMMPRLTAFFLMLLLTIYTVYNALKYNRAEIAMLGLVGAYAIPFFVRGNSDSLSGLFSYILVINLGVLFLSFKKYWLSVNYLSFFSSWTIYFSCLYIYDDHSSTALIFGVALYVLFMLSSLGFKLYRKYRIEYSDTIIIIINAFLLYFAWGLYMYANDHRRDGMLPLVFAVVYFAAGLLSKKILATQPLLSNSLFAVGIFNFILFFPLHFNGFVITISWVVLAVGLFIAGMYYRIKLFRLGAIVLFAFTIFKLLFFDSNDFTSLQKVVAYIFTGTVLLVVSFLYQRFRERIFND